MFYLIVRGANLDYRDSKNFENAEFNAFHTEESVDYEYSFKSNNTFDFGSKRYGSDKED